MISRSGLLLKPGQKEEIPTPKGRTPKSQISVTFVLMAGGHAFEVLALADRFAPEIEISYIICKDDLLTKHKIRVPGQVYKIWPSLRSIRAGGICSLTRKAICFMPSVIQSIRLLKKVRAHAIITNGSGAALAVMFAAWLLRRKIIFIESACRIKSRSLSGFVAYHLFADLFFVQWEEQLTLYPRAIYAGRPF